MLLLLFTIYRRTLRVTCEEGTTIVWYTLNDRLRVICLPTLTIDVVKVVLCCNFYLLGYTTKDLTAYLAVAKTNLALRVKNLIKCQSSCTR